MKKFFNILIIIILIYPTILFSANVNYFKTGKNYLKTFHYRKAIKFFSKAAENSDRRDAYFYIGLCCYKLQQFKKAETYFNLSKILNIKVEESNFFLGLSNYYIGNYKKAISLFKHSSKKFYRESNYFKKLCEDNLAKREKLKKILKIDNNTISYFTDITYDSNLLKEPKSSTSPPTHKSDLFNEHFLKIKKNLAITESFSIIPEISLYRSFYHDYTNLNLSFFAPALNFQFLTEKFLLKISPFYEFVTLDNKPYEKNYKIIADSYLMIKSNNLFNIKVLTGRENFRHFNAKDCYFFKLHLNEFFQHSNFIYNFGFNFSSENANGNNYKFNAVGGTAGLTFYIANDFILKNNIFYEYRDYNNNKWEKTLKMIFNATYLRSKLLRLGFAFKVLKNFSNDDVFDYTTSQSTIFISLNL